MEPGLVRRRRGGITEAALQFLDLRGGPTEPIRVHAVGIEPPEDRASPYRLALCGGEPSVDVDAVLDPRTGEPLGKPAHAWACAVGEEGASMAMAVRRYARALTGVNRRASLARSGWSPGTLLSRRQIFPLDPPHLVCLGARAWIADEVFCVTPTCPCKNLSVDFEVLREAATEAPPLTAAIDLVSWTITETRGNGPARELAEAWMAQPGSRARARDLFARAHDVGRELLDPFVVHRGSVRPEGPCPCGSRRRYKQCCGRRSPPPVPGDLHALQERARRTLVAFAAEVLPEPLELTESEGVASPFRIPSMDCRLAWLLYWRRFDGYTLADRFLADPERGDPWLRCWLEAASGAPPDIFEVKSLRGQEARLTSLADLDAPDVQVLRPPGGLLRSDDAVLAAPVQIMGRTVLEGAWRASTSKEVSLALHLDLRSAGDEIDRLQRPARVLQAMFEVLADVEAADASR